MKLIPVDNRKSSGVSRVIRMMVAVIKIIVDDDNRSIVPTQGAPSNIIVAPIPMDPSRTPITGGNPVPAETKTPVPSAIMVNTPSPGFVGHPGPAANRIPNPATVIIGTPIRINDIRYPDIAIRPFINPVAVGFKLSFILIKLSREVATRGILPEQGIPVPIPGIKVISF